MNRDWLEFLQQQGMTLNGADSSHFQGAESEKPRVAEGEFICALTDQSWLRVDGADAETFLQGQFTNDLASLPPQGWQLGGYCNAQGRLLCLLRIGRRGQGFLLQLPSDLASAVTERLRRYVLRSKVSMAISDELSSIGFSGPRAKALLNEVEPALPGAGIQQPPSKDVLIWRHPGGVDRCQLIGPVPALRSFWQRTVVPAVGNWAWHWQNIANGIPLITSQTSEQFVPQMVNLDLIEGVSFSKGCYPGQEIVARMHYLGKLKQRMIRAFVTTPPPLPGDRLYLPGEQQSVGRVVTAQPSPTQSGSELLAVVRLSALDADIFMGDADGPPLQRLDLPYAVESPHQRQV